MLITLGVEVAKDCWLARQFSVMGTPTFVAVADGRILDVKLGAPGRAWLQLYLERQKG